MAINIVIDALWRNYGSNCIGISACLSLRSNHALLNSFPPLSMTPYGVIMVMGIYMGSSMLADILVLHDQYNGLNTG